MQFISFFAFNLFLNLEVYNIIIEYKKDVMYLLVGTKETKNQVNNIKLNFDKNKIENIVYISSNMKNGTLFIEKNWKKYEKVIFVDVEGIFPFMYLSKIHKLVVSTITDVYSAYMTPLHNNTRIMIIPTSIIADDFSIKLSKFFINAKFEAGRHMARIDMLDRETK